jgi:hypothetical protein
MNLWRRRNRRKGYAWLRWANRYMRTARNGYRRIAARIRYARTIQRRTSAHARHYFRVYIARLQRRLGY